MQTMYPAVVNSPKTELVVAITETDTEIEVADVSVLLQPEGLAVIGNGEGAETIKYTEVEGNILKNCIRGFQGTAKPWGAGTRLARNFTAYDHDAFMSNIEQHDTAINALEDRLNTADTQPVTLQPGLQVVDAAKDARFKLGEIIGKTEINYEGRIGIVGVENPYAIVYEDNLLPPFYEWRTVNTDGRAKITGPYVLEIQGVAGAGFWYEVDVPVIVSRTYTLSGYTSEPSKLYALAIDEAGAAITGYLTGTFTIPPSTKHLRIYANTDTSPNLVKFENPMLVIGDAARPFKPQRKTMLAFQTELHANPSDGSEPDILFEKDGQYYKLANWDKISLDSLVWEGAGTLGSTESDPYVILRAKLPKAPLPWVHHVVKYDGTKLSNATAGVWGASDSAIIPGDGYIYISVKKSDSGWGDGYTPTADELKAYFMGWRMRDSETLDPYNGSGTKAWGTVMSGGGSYYTSTLPTSKAPDYENPYQLLYRLAQDIVEPVVSEGSLVLPEGQSVVEVGTGIVLRERANPVNIYNQNVWAVVNHIQAPGSALTYKLGEFVCFYKDDKEFYGWGVRKSPTVAFGNAYLDRPWSEFDRSAAYSVTYLKLDKSPIQPITGTLAANDKAQISDLTAGVTEALQRVSVVEQKKAEKDAPGWITPTLLNGWINYDLSQYDPVGFYKDSLGEVHLRGMISDGAVTPGTTLFRLPAGYRPKKHKALQALGSNDGNTVSSTFLAVSPLGEVILMRGANNAYLSLCIPTFLAEQ